MNFFPNLLPVPVWVIFLRQRPPASFSIPHCEPILLFLPHRFNLIVELRFVSSNWGVKWLAVSGSCWMGNRAGRPIAFHCSGFMWEQLSAEKIIPFIPVPRTCKLLDIHVKCATNLKRSVHCTKD